MISGTNSFFRKQFNGLIVSAAVGFSVFSAIAAPSPLQYKTFTNGSALWISEPAGMIMYRNDTRSVRNVVLCDTADNDSIRDIAENSSALWVLAASGAYQIDLATTTVERLPGNRKGSLDARLAVDDDYLWLGISDTLWRFDKLGREWFPYPVKSADNPLCGMFSDGTNVYCVQSTSIKIFSVQQEKWREFPYPKGMSISPASQLFLDKNALVFVEGASIFRYIIDAQSWDVIAAPSPVIDMLSQDTVVFYLTSSGAFQYFTKTSVTRPLDVPDISKVTCFARMQDTLFCPVQKSCIKYDISAKVTDYIETPQNVTDFSVRKALIFKDTLITLCPDHISTLDLKSNLWQSVPLTAVVKKKTSFVWDDDNGARLSWAKGCYSQLRGNIQQDIVFRTTDSLGLTYSIPQLFGTLTLHNKFTRGNYCDVFFDNSDISHVAKKGLFYRGAPDDRVESARLGSNTIEIPQSTIILQPEFEGGNVKLQSISSLTTRDRKIVKAQAGGGLITTKTFYEVLPYSLSRSYHMEKFRSDTSVRMEIVPGSLKVSIDGEEIDSMDFSFSVLTGSLSFNRQDLVDPTSLITVSYQVRTLPDKGPSEIELAPENNFGTVGYASAMVSPTDWISPQAGFLQLKTDSATHELVTVSTPSEIRSGRSDIFFKFNPEFTYDAQTDKKAAGLSLQSRFGEKLSFLFNGLMPDSGFVTTDNLDRGYGFLRHKSDFTIGFDPRKELPFSYYQHDFISAHGLERYYSLSAGAHFQGFPFLDVLLSRNNVTTDVNDTLRDSTGAVDSVLQAMDRNKDKLRVRLYETSSPIFESLLHIHRLNYELSYTGFKSSKEGTAETGYGNIFYGRGAVSPTKRVTFAVEGTYLRNAPGSLYLSEYNPSFILQTIDAPRGFDVSARSETDFKSVAGRDSSFSTLHRGANVTVKPGDWFDYLGWIQPVLGFNQAVHCGFNGYSPGISTLLFSPRHITSEVTTSGAGANIFPTNDITIRNDNQFTTADSMTRYRLFNDFKWRFGDKRFWQIRWEYDRDRPRFTTGQSRDFNTGFTRFTNTWVPWLMTQTGVSSSITVTNATSSVRVGPDATVSINLEKFSFVRSLLNTHSITAFWNRNGRSWQPSPDIAYSLDLQVIVLPNFSISSKNSFTMTSGSSTQYYGLLSVRTIF